MFVRSICAVAGAALLSLSLANASLAQDAQGAGSTFVAPMIAKWADVYAKKTGIKIAYDSVGSGAGIERIEAGSVDFGATDKPLPPSELAKYGLCQFPIVVGAVVPVVNLAGVAPGQMKFTGQVLADIYQGKIKRWDDPAIKELNGDVALPSTPITVVHRSDGSGTTYNWVDFLAKSSADWKSKVGVGLAVSWPVGVGGKGNDGVAAAVLQTPGAIGYVEYSIALKNKMAIGQVRNSFNLFIPPGPDAFQAAAATVDWKSAPDFSVMMTNAGGATSYPIAATTFIVMPKTPKDRTRAAATLKFFKWALEAGDKEATDLKYVPLPFNLIHQIEVYWKSHIDLGRNSADLH